MLFGATARVVRWRASNCTCTLEVPASCDAQRQCVGTVLAERVSPSFYPGKLQLHDERDAVVDEDALWKDVEWPATGIRVTARTLTD